ncbi:MAG: adenylyltransferase/cytidyltransferase family protein [Clostridiales bacterium]|nr:adenylyltransferase/cytidyltransferase family protein [Clostridiales bacterium]
MKKVITFGVFDYFHFGHLRLIENASKYGDYLIVAVQDEAYIKKYKPNTDILYSTEQRIEMLRALRAVDEVVLYSDVSESIKLFDFDVFAVGADQQHSGFQKAIEYCKANGKEVVRLERTQGISSTLIRKELLKD